MKLNTFVMVYVIGFSLQGNFEIKVEQPKILKEHFANSISYLEIMPGKIKENYQKQIVIKALTNNKTGCKKYKEDYHNNEGQEIGILLIDSDNCSLSTKIHFAQLAGASVLFLKYIDDNIEEAVVDHSSFEGVRIPIFMLKSSDAEYISDVLQSEGSLSQLTINLSHFNEFDKSQNKIDIYMNSQPHNNPMIMFLKDLKEHKQTFANYIINIRFSLGFCKSCKEKNYLKKEPSCLSGGRYCVINSEFKTSEPVLETLRQICIRKVFGNDKLIDYMINFRQNFYELQANNLFKEKNYSVHSYETMNGLKINADEIKQCVDNSFQSRTSSDQTDKELDDNNLLKEEQEEFFKITKLNTYPLIMINKVPYSGSINFRDFIKFGCENHLFDCRGFKGFKKTFLLIMTALSVCFVFIIAVFCRRVLKKKYDNEINIKFEEAIQKYLTVNKV